MTHWIDPELVIVENRQRKFIDRKKLADLSESLKRFGQLQAGICREVDGRPHLIIGERRLRACGLAKIKFKYELDTETSDPLLLKEIELTENLDREDLTWQEKADARAELHFLREKLHGKDPEAKGNWTYRDSADAMGISIGNLSEAVETSIWMREIPEIRDSKNLSDARSKIKRIRQAVTDKDSLKEAMTKAAQASVAIKDSSLQPKIKEEASSDEHALLLEYDRRCILGNFEDVASKFQEGAFTVVVWDPPWGENLDKVSKSSGTTKDFDDDPRLIWEKFPYWLSTIWNLMAEDSHLYLVFGIRNYSIIYSTLEKQGFVTNGMPLFWYKKGAHVTRNPEIWPGRCYEAIAYARKGKKPLVQFGRPDIIPTPMPVPSIKKIHPSAKHPQLLLDLIERSCRPGEAILDPMAGSGMFGVAADYLRSKLALDWYQVEMEPAFRNLQLTNLLKGYLGIIGEKEEETKNDSGQVTN